MRHSTMRIRLLAVAATAMLLSGASCASAQMSAERAAAVPAVLRVCVNYDDTACDGGCFAKAAVLKILKNETDREIGQFVEIAYSSRGPKLVDAESTVYLREGPGSSWYLDDDPIRCLPGWTHLEPDRGSYPAGEELENFAGCPRYSHLEIPPLCASKLPGAK